MEVYSILSEGYTKMYIISDSAVSENRLDVYLNNVYKGSFVEDDYADLTLPETDKYLLELQFVARLTSNGTMQIFEFTPVDIEQAGPKFEEGVYHFLLRSEINSPLPLFGAIQDEAVLCCMASALENGDSCLLKSVDSINEKSAYLLSAKANLRLRNAKTATCLYNTAVCNCEGCN